MPSLVRNPHSIAGVCFFKSKKKEIAINFLTPTFKFLLLLFHSLIPLTTISVNPNSLVIDCNIKYIYSVK
jgi:hypothetical protein